MTECSRLAATGAFYLRQQLAPLPKNTQTLSHKGFTAAMTVYHSDRQPPVMVREISLAPQGRPCTGCNARLRLALADTLAENQSP